MNPIDEIVVVELVPPVKGTDVKIQKQLYGLRGETLKKYLKNIKQSPGVQLKVNVPVKFPLLIPDVQSSNCQTMATETAYLAKNFLPSAVELSRELLVEIEGETPVSKYVPLVEKDPKTSIGLLQKNACYLPILTLKSLLGFLENLKEYSYCSHILKPFNEDEKQTFIFKRAKFYGAHVVLPSWLHKSKGLALQIELLELNPEVAAVKEDENTPSLFYGYGTRSWTMLFAQNEESVCHKDGLVIKRDQVIDWQKKIPGTIATKIVKAKSFPRKK